ncbi:response regulator transcription factor [Agrilutibacter niabensis]|uniref:response regulator transcription factor n=1 Tax=Agrilutibacter niabensis TaxID=380628 RepID=UPI00286C6A4D|nr:response regulator transcription factor [Lysobacter niabensis]
MPNEYNGLKILLAEDHRVVAEGLERVLLECFASVEVVSEGQQLLDAVQASSPDVIVADISMPGMGGLQALRSLRAAGNTTPFLILTMHDAIGFVEEALHCGANGYVPKHAAGEELVRAIREVASGATYVSTSLSHGLLSNRLIKSARLTRRQLDVLNGLAKGYRSKQIAAELGIATRTVETHKYAMMQAFGVHNGVELVRAAERHGLIEPA